jgi:DNA replication and repair protein RecF
MLKNIRLQNFRSYSDSFFEFNPKINVIVGPNASGKTNLLEAILVLARGKSYRAKDLELIQFKKDWAIINIRLSNGSNRNIKLNSKTLPKKLYELNGKQSRTLKTEQKLPLVLFEPNHLQLISGSPEKRRDYLDDLLEQTITGYDKLRRQYSRALTQRNSLLKQLTHSNKPQIFPWNMRLSELAGQMVKLRLGLIEELNTNTPKLYKELSSSKASAELQYLNKWPLDSYESQLLKDLENNLNNDIAQGFTSHGPHREDFQVLFNNHPIQQIASRGEVRTFLLALKINEIGLIEETRDASPIILLDDVFSELDIKRRHALTDHLGPYQTFITTTDADLMAKELIKPANIIELMVN